MGERSASLKDDLARVNVTSVKDIRTAAEALRDIAWERANLRVALADNIASKNPLMDEDGGILAAEVFGWNAPDERWWRIRALRCRRRCRAPVAMNRSPSG